MVNMKGLIYNSEPLRKRAVLLAQERRVSQVCRDLGITRTHFYDVVNGLSSSHEMLINVARELGVPMRLLISTEDTKKPRTPKGDSVASV